MNNEKIPSKWNFIKNELIKMNAPAMLVNEAEHIEHICKSNNLETPTIKYVELYLSYTGSLQALYDIVSLAKTCTPCDKYIMESCDGCPLEPYIIGDNDCHPGYEHTKDFLMEKIKEELGLK